MTRFPRLLETWYRACFLAIPSLRLVRNALASTVKLLIGRQAYFNADERFVFLYLLSALGIGPRLAVTTRTDQYQGAGIQAGFAMTAQCFAELFGIAYVHSPFAKIAHNDLQREDWEEAWEQHFNLGSEERTSVPDGAKVLPEYPLIGPLVGSHFAARLFDLYRPKFVEKYRSNKDPRVAPDTLAVVAHLRRGDVVNEAAETRWADNAGALAAILRVRAILDEANLAHSVRLFSEGEREDFAELERAGVEVILNGNAVEAHRQMIDADVLVMGRGYFSWVAALLSDGVAIYDPWGEQPALRSWIVRAPDGSFDERRFRSALEKRRSIGR